MQKTKTDLSFFGFSQVFNHQFIHKKNQKTLSFFSFFKVMTEKNQTQLEENKKKTSMNLRPNFLWKVLVFWFSRGFFCFWFSPWLLS